MLHLRRVGMATQQQRLPLATSNNRLQIYTQFAISLTRTAACQTNLLQRYFFLYEKSKSGRGQLRAKGIKRACVQESLFMQFFPINAQSFALQPTLFLLLCTACGNFTTLSTFLPLAKVNSINFLPLLWQLQRRQQQQQ